MSNGLAPIITSWLKEAENKWNNFKSTSSHSPTTIEKNAVNAAAVGAIIAITFHAYDRASFFATTAKNPKEQRLFTWTNWQHPFQGLSHTFGHRMLASGTYFFLQSLAFDQLKSEEAAPLDQKHPKITRAVLGLIIGAANGFITNPTAVVRSACWNNRSRPVPFLTESMQMYRTAGAKIFFKGALDRIIRDSIFAIIYESVRYSLQDKMDKFSASIFAATLATFGAIPFNYSMVIKHGTLASEPVLGTREILTRLLEKGQTPLEIANKLGLDRGIARSAMSFAASRYLFDLLRENPTNKTERLY